MANLTPKNQVPKNFKHFKNTNNQVPTSLEKIGKKKRKFLAKRLKDCDPSKIEELLKANLDNEVVKAFKNKPNKKRKPKVKVEPEKPEVMKMELPKNAQEASSNWASIVSKGLTKPEPKVPKEKQIFYRRKNGKLVTNDPTLQKEAEVEDSSAEAPKEVSEDVWFDDVDPVLLDVAQRVNMISFPCSLQLIIAPGEFLFILLEASIPFPSLAIQLLTDPV